MSNTVSEQHIPEMTEEGEGDVKGESVEEENTPQANTDTNSELTTASVEDGSNLNVEKADPETH